MPDKDLTPIPMPAGQRWREFRVVYLPPLTFLALVAVISWMWVNYVEPGAIIGEVETIHANVISTAGGTMQDLKVDLLQTVTNGQELAVVTGLDPDQLKAEIAAAESDLQLMKARMDLDKTRNLNAYSQLRVQLLEEKFNLDVARIRLQQAQQEFERAQKLLDSQLIARGVNPSLSGGNFVSPRNDFGYEVAVRDRDALQTEVATREKAVVDLEANVKDLERTGAIKVDPADAAVERAVRAQRERIEQLQKPQVLCSPIDGFISAINCRPGARIAAREVVLVVSGRKSDRIVAWFHPPITRRPQIGDVVAVRRMGLGQATFEGTVVQVGSQLEPVSPMLRTPTANPERIEVGLPLLVQAAAAVDLIPGEAVQVRIVRQVRAAGAN
jgi:multidrug resistance efflux pump